MKSIQTIRILVLLAMLAAGVVSCQKEELPATGGDAPQGIPLTISFTDGGYASAQVEAPHGAPKTRATENGYITQFTAGDKIGLYAVVGNTIVTQNVCLIAADNGQGGVNWTGNAYYEGAGAKYFAYYPYQTSIVGNPVATASDAAGFFADVVSKWNPATDQSTHAKYTAQDLMVGSGTVSKQTDGTLPLSFTMTHAMALVIIETPTTKYTFTNSSPNIPDYYTPAPNTTFYGFTPYSPAMGIYRLLVKPAQTKAANLTGSYTIASGNTKEYTLTQNSLDAANYAYYKVDGAAVITKKHMLQAGDFYLKDGSLIGKNENPTTEQKAACVGIVYWVGDPTNTTNGDPLLKRDQPGCTHGLVVALHEATPPSAFIAAKMQWSVSYETVNNWTNHADRDDNKVNITAENKMQGYANTVALKAYNTSSNVQNNANLKVLPIASIEQYQTNYPAPANSSGWYLPSIMELKYVCWGQENSLGITGRNLLNAQFTKVDGTSLEASWHYWSSSERADDSNYAWRVDFLDGYVSNYFKDSRDKFWVRALFAF